MKKTILPSNDSLIDTSGIVLQALRELQTLQENCGSDVPGHTGILHIICDYFEKSIEIECSGPVDMKLRKVS